ncbi:MAG TPA: 5-(carboxyamino)imidazole ribonucleotide synthase [Myxococcales bacterium]|nr:5-(carboxyamino)imidazole ribonucleotide synthase [Myxococcales bacterium]
MALRYHYLMRIGIIGGGQLGKMLALKAKAMGFHVSILDPYPHAPAALIADRHILGSVRDTRKLRELVDACDITTFDLEDINADALEALEKEGHHIHPSPGLLKIIQDKFVQKQFLADKGIPVPRFQAVDEPTPEAFAAFGYPLVQKLRRGGYDGRGVAVLESAAQVDDHLPGPSMLEEKVEIEKELALMVARSSKGQLKCHPLVEMVFDPEANICDVVMAPALVVKAQEEESIRIASQAIEALEGVGIFGVELFLTRDGRILLNEIAPRTHNSGHFTIEACITDQFEQHLRSVAGLPLGATDLLIPAVMVNLLGAPEVKGKPSILGMREAMDIPGLSFHLYGKAETRPFRKMGHITIVDHDVHQAREKAQRARQILKVTVQN